MRSKNGKRTGSMMGIASPTASHLPVLTAAVESAPPGSIVIEHGAGLYSTPLLARSGFAVVCIEPHPGWGEWARWIYDEPACVVDAIDDETLSRAAVVFIDGPGDERGPLLDRCLRLRIPTIIAHDTNPTRREWRAYGLESRMFEHPDYDITHSAEDTHRTTLWKLKP
jgi:hypothetical protein